MPASRSSRGSFESVEIEPNAEQCRSVVQKIQVVFAHPRAAVGDFLDGLMRSGGAALAALEPLLPLPDGLRGGVPIEPSQRCRRVARSARSGMHSISSSNSFQMTADLPAGTDAGRRRGCPLRPRVQSADFIRQIGALPFQGCPPECESFHPWPAPPPVPAVPPGWLPGCAIYRAVKPAFAARFPSRR